MWCAHYKGEARSRNVCRCRCGETGWARQRECSILKCVTPKIPAVPMTSDHRVQYHCVVARAATAGSVAMTQCGERSQSVMGIRC